MAKKNEVLEIVENIVTQSLDDIISDRFASYAKYVIQNRAIPDVADGLKPVQRRIIYAMHESSNTYDKPHRKCARITGNVIGRFHPHGSASVYEALCRLSQNWKINEPLIDFQGNNGSIDGDPPAAERYTEARLSKVANLLVRNIDKKITDFQLNYSDEELEPIVLPSYIPNLFINGTEGIAVSLATKIPPHNLKEMCEATIYRIEHPDCTLDELLPIVKGPDLPTGGIIYDNGGIRNIYETGRGSFDIASKVEIFKKGDVNQLIVSEIPYEVVKQRLVFSIDEIRKEKLIDGILDVKDLSAGDEIRIIIDLKKDADAKIIQQYLMNKTQLKVSFSANIVAICNNHPKTLSLIQYLDYFIEHLIKINTKSYSYDLEKDEKRLHIIDGLIKANSIIDEIVHLIRNSQNKEDARNNLMNKYDFSYEQAEAILNIRLYRLSHTDVQVYYQEKEELEKEIKKIKNILTNKKVLLKCLTNDLNDIIKDFGHERRTIIQEKTETISIDKRDLIAKEDNYVVLTHDGYIKRSSIKSYKACEGQLPGLKEGDSLVLSEICSTLDYVLAFTNKGNYIFIPVHEIPETKWKDEGKHVNFLTNLPLNEYIIKTIIVKDFTKDVSIAILTKNGQIKKSSLGLFFASRYSKPIQCIKLSGNDEVCDVSVLNNNSNILVLTESGLGSYFNERQISQTGLKTSGVKAISTKRGSNLKVLLSFKEDEKDKLLFITDHGMYRIYDSSNLVLTQRLGATQFLFKSFKSDPHKLIYASKILDKKAVLDLNGIYDDNSIFSFNIDDYHLTPIDKYCKKNIDSLDDKKVIKAIFNESCQIIDENTLVEEKIVEEVESNNSEESSQMTLDLSIEDNNQVEDKKEVVNNDKHVKDQEEKDEDPVYEQISIFDDYGD